MQVNRGIYNGFRIVALSVLGCTTAYSQTRPVEPARSIIVTGHVTDPTGADIPKAIISLEGSDGTNLQIPAIEMLDASLTSTLPLNPLPPLKLRKHIAR
jgi:hypothetical protein